MVYIRALEDFGPNVTVEQIGQTVLNYVGDQHGTFWWGGYGNSTEHTAYLNLANGFQLRYQALIALNGPTIAEQSAAKFSAISGGWSHPTTHDWLLNMPAKLPASLTVATPSTADNSSPPWSARLSARRTRCA